MDEIVALAKECIETKFEEDVTANVLNIREECLGLSFQILFINYKEGLRKIKVMLLEMLKLKLQALKDDFMEEAQYFLDLIDNLIEKDYSLLESFLAAKKAAKYYVSPRYFNQLVDVCWPYIQAFDKIHFKLRDQRNEIQFILKDKDEEE